MQLRMTSIAGREVSKGKQRKSYLQTQRGKFDFFYGTAHEKKCCAALGLGVVLILKIYFLSFSACTDITRY